MVAGSDTYMFKLLFVFFSTVITKKYIWLALMFFVSAQCLKDIDGDVSSQRTPLPRDTCII